MNFCAFKLSSGDMSFSWPTYIYATVKAVTPINVCNFNETYSGFIENLNKILSFNYSTFNSRCCTKYSIKYFNLLMLKIKLFYILSSLFLLKVYAHKNIPIL